MACGMEDVNERKCLLIAIVMVGSVVAGVVAQHCGCPAQECCSQWGYCGRSQDFCGVGCQEGPCDSAPVTVATMVSTQFFCGILDRADGSCAGKRFYSRQAFLEALPSYPMFGKIGPLDDNMREIAAFFAHVTLETGYLCYIEEIDGPFKDYCDESNTQYPCNPNKGYYGRGPIQLSWNFNYGPAGKSIGFDGVNSPEILATDAVISFKVSLWYWMNAVRPVLSQGFGATIRAINGARECYGKDPTTVQARVQYYTEYCNQLGVAPGDNLYC